MRKIIFGLLLWCLHGAEALQKQKLNLAQLDSVIIDGVADIELDKGGEGGSYTSSQGPCRGGETWDSGDVWDCTLGALSAAECAAACDAKSGCSSYNLEDHGDEEDDSDCCLYKSGNVGDGDTDGTCYSKSSPADSSSSFLISAIGSSEKTQPIMWQHRRKTSGDALPKKFLSQTDFDIGTKVLNETGRYILTEDILFEPQPMHPELNSTAYPQGDGYFLGFFAAISIEGSEKIVLDCQGRSIAMSDKFFKHQRFFSIIELGSRPFIPNAGPPPLANAAMTPTEFRTADNVVIKNCVLGKSSHHGIHGNNVKRVRIVGTTINNFEVAGISLNNASSATIIRTNVGPSLSETFPASLSQAIFLNHMATKIGLSDDYLQPVFEQTQVTLRGETKTAKEVVGKLENDLADFMAEDSTGDLKTLLGTMVIPDGSAIYGILLHKSGPAVGDFGACPLETFTGTLGETLIEGTELRDVTIKELKLKPEAWISLHQDGKQVQGPAGAVFRATQLQGNDGEYVGNSLSDAMIAVNAVLRSAVEGTGIEAAAKDATKERAQEYFSASSIPTDIIDWAASAPSLKVPLNYTKFQLKCSGDAMSHFNKGIVAIRLAYQENPRMKRVSITNLQNSGEGPENAALCTDNEYKGNDVRALRLTNVVNVMGVTADGMIPGEGGEIHNTEARNTFEPDPTPSPTAAS